MKIERRRHPLVRLLRRWHLDLAGDMVQKILIIAAIALPILIVLLLFRNEISAMFKTQKDNMKAEYQKTPTY